MDVFQRTRFYTEIVVHSVLLHRDAFTQRWHTQKHFYTHTHFYSEIILRWAALHTDTITHRGAFTKEWIYTRSFYIRMFLHRHTLHDFRRRARISRYQSSASRCKTALSPQLLAIETHFVGTGWPSANPHRNLISLFGDQHFVRGGCVSWTPVHAALPS
jgi:hypothetical protein